jgi:5-(carboxyamino)imidazole ribonucleotide synthase
MGSAESDGPIGLPCVLKTRRMGYDGKGQAVIRSAAEIDDAFAAVAGSAGKDGGSSQQAPSLIVESFVPFVRELSLICVRSAAGQTRFYPLIENRHAQGILRVSIAPAPPPTPPSPSPLAPSASTDLQHEAERLGARVLDTLGYVGVLTIELFQVGEGASAKLLGNELAPRVHNSGHWTIDGAATSQFENHLRAMLGAGPHAVRLGPQGLALGPTTMREGSACAAMVNIVGPPLPSPGAFPAESWCRPHLYAKSPRPGRKVGHVNVLGSNQAELRERVEIVRRIAASMQG